MGLSASPPPGMIGLLKHIGWFDRFKGRRKNKLVLKRTTINPSTECLAILVFELVYWSLMQIKSIFLQNMKDAFVAK